MPCACPTCDRARLLITGLSVRSDFVSSHLSAMLEKALFDELDLTGNFSDIIHDAVRQFLDWHWDYIKEREELVRAKALPEDVRKMLHEKLKAIDMDMARVLMLIQEPIA